MFSPGFLLYVNGSLFPNRSYNATVTPFLWRCSLCQPVIMVWRASGAATSQCVKAHWPGLEIGRVPVSRRTVQSHPPTKRPLIKSVRLPARRLLEFITRKGRRACKTNFRRSGKQLPSPCGDLAGMQKRAKRARHRARIIISVLLCLPLAMFALPAENHGVASERSGYESVCESALAWAGNRTRSGFSEDSASRMG
jgi:hypothetical protein